VLVHQLNCIRFKAYQFINRTVFVLLGLVGLDIQSIYGYTRYLISIFLLLVEVFPYCIQYYTNTIPYNHTCFKACAARLRVQPVRVFEGAGWCPSVTAPKDTWLIFSIPTTRRYGSATRLRMKVSTGSITSCLAFYIVTTLTLATRRTCDANFAQNVPKRTRASRFLR
jgi:hypothetical protein